MITWNHATFAQLFKHSPKEAFEYRFKAQGIEVPEEYQDSPIEPTVEQMKELLTSNDIKFSHLAGEKKLMELCKANNLL